MATDTYRKLQEKLDTYSLGFPATESGIEIRILEKLFNEEDANLFLQMSHQLETPETVASRTNIDKTIMAQKLEDMAQKGLLFRHRKDDIAKYSAIPFMHGLLEYQINRLDRSLAEMFEQYYEEGLRKNIAESADLFLRTVPVDQSIELEHHVATIDDASELLRNAKRIAVADCICRKEKETTGKSCGKPMEACFMFGSMASYYIENNMGREIDADEAIEMVKKAQESGLVTQPSTTQNPAGMCNCCGDCCGVLNSIKRHPKPAEIVFANYFAYVNKENCSGCEICIDRCQMEAITINSEGLAEITRDRCIGCGLCVVPCPTEAMVLQPKPESERRTPPVTSAEQMFSMAQKRGIIS